MAVLTEDDGDYIMNNDWLKHAFHVYECSTEHEFIKTIGFANTFEKAEMLCSSDKHFINVVYINDNKVLSLSFKDAMKITLQHKRLIKQGIIPNFIGLPYSGTIYVRDADQISTVKLANYVTHNVL